MTMNILLLVFVFVCLIVSAVDDVRSCKKLVLQDITESVRLKYYRLSIFLGFFPLTIVAIIYVIFSDVSFADIGLCWFNPPPIGWFSIVVYIVCALAFLLFLYQTVMGIISQEYREKAKEQIEQSLKKASHYDLVINKLVLPQTKKEKVWFSFVSLNAGIGEEIICRGLIMFLLQSIFPFLNFFTAGIVSCLVFAVIHSYQGFLGMIKTGLAGFMFLSLFYTTGTLIPVIILHFFVDFSSTFINSSEKEQL